MVPLASLWLPILVSAVMVLSRYVGSSTCSSLHRSGFMQNCRMKMRFWIHSFTEHTRGQYLAPYANSTAQMQQPEYLGKAQARTDVFP